MSNLRPKVGIIYYKSGNFFSISKAFREPTRSDFESNPEIKPEELVDIELGWNYKLEGILINANWYYMKYKNQLVLTGEIDDVGAPIRENSGQSYRRGLEIESLLNLSNKITINANMSLSKNKNINYLTSFNSEIVNLGNTQISFSPKLVSSIGFSFTPTNKLYLTLITKHIGDQFMSNTDSNLSKLDSYTISDFNIVYKLKNTKLFNEITISAIINNLLNIDYVSNGYYYTYDDTWTDPNQAVTYEGVGYYPQATRNYLLGITFKF